MQKKKKISLMLQLRENVEKWSCESEHQGKMIKYEERQKLIINIVDYQFH